LQGILAAMPEAKPVATGTVRVPDGRSVVWTAWGAAEGRTVFLQPHVGVASQRALVDDVAPIEAVGVRLVACARAGIGGSDRRPGRTEQTDAEDMLAILDDLGLDRVDLIGECGGVGAVLAFAARWPDRVGCVALVSAMAPLAGPDAPSYSGRLRGVPRTFRYRRLARWRIRSAPDVDRVLGSDPARLAHGAIALAEFYSSPDAVIDEWRAVIGPWSIDFDAIRAPVVIDHGELDPTTPVAMARWLGRRIPSAELRIDPSRGHLMEPARFASLVAGLSSNDPVPQT
jgi:pimeloyl-ACP methyl ester carboxylesterase